MNGFFKAVMGYFLGDSTWKHMEWNQKQERTHAQDARRSLNAGEKSDDILEACSHYADAAASLYVLWYHTKKGG